MRFYYALLPFPSFSNVIVKFSDGLIKCCIRVKAFSLELILGKGLSVGDWKENNVPPIRAWNLSSCLPA